MKQALPAVWVIANRPTKTVSYLQVSETKKGEQTTLGPFIYSSEQDARKAAAHPDFLPSDLIPTVELDAIQFPGANLIEGILQGFPPSDTDAFCINDDFLPLTPTGAEWVDHLVGAPRWAPLFLDQSQWVNTVLQQVSHHLGVAEIRVHESEALRQRWQVARAISLIKKHVEVIITPEEFSEGMEIGPQTTFWLHTLGMSELDREDLEVRHVPAWYVNHMVNTIKAWAAYSLDHPISAGDRMQEDPSDVGLPVQIMASPSEDPYWIRRNRCFVMAPVSVHYQGTARSFGLGADEFVH